jgi:hypothetical protein
MLGISIGMMPPDVREAHVKLPNASRFDFDAAIRRETSD